MYMVTGLNPGINTFTFQYKTPSNNAMAAEYSNITVIPF